MSGRTPELAVLTRPQGRNEWLAARLRETGWQVLVLPALRLQTLIPQRLPHPADYDLVVLVSGNAARLYLSQLALAHPGFRWPPATRAAVVGQASAAILQAQAGWHPEAAVLQPAADAPQHDSEALWAALQAAGPMPRRVLIVRGEQGRDWLAARLREQGAQVDFLPLYRRCAQAWPVHATDRLQRLHAEGGTACWLLSSAEGLQAVRQQLSAMGLADWFARCPAVVTHPRLAGLLRGGGVDTIGNGEQGGPMVKISLPTEQALFESFAALR